jgi:hypothetical protein
VYWFESICLKELSFCNTLLCVIPGCYFLSMLCKYFSYVSPCISPLHNYPLVEGICAICFICLSSICSATLEVKYSVYSCVLQSSSLKAVGHWRSDWISLMSPVSFCNRSWSWRCGLYDNWCTYSCWDCGKNDVLCDCDR